MKTFKLNRPNNDEHYTMAHNQVVFHPSVDHNWFTTKTCHISAMSSQTDHAKGVHTSKHHLGSFGLTHCAFNLCINEQSSLVGPSVGLLLDSTLKRCSPTCCLAMCNQVLPMSKFRSGASLEAEPFVNACKTDMLSV